jgi:hypothetical protein
MMIAMAKNIDQADDAEEVAYSRAYFATHDSIREALMRVDIALGKVKLDLQDQLTLMGEKADLVGKQSKLEAARQAFSQGNAAIDPPSDAQVQAIKTNLDQLRALTSSAAAAKSAISLATNALTLFNKIQHV